MVGQMKPNLKNIMARLSDGKAGAVHYVERLGGLNHQTYEVNHQYVVRFPSVGEPLDIFRKKAQLMAILGEYIKFKLPQIEIKEFSADESVADIPVFDGRVVAQVYPKIQGDTLNEKQFSKLPPSVQDGILTGQAAFAAQMHTVPLGRLYGLIDSTFMDNLSARIDDSLPELRRYDETFRARLKRTVFDETGWQCGLVATYDDQHLGNGVFDVQTGKTVGMFDMDDIAVRPLGNARGLRLFSKEYSDSFKEKYAEAVGRYVAPQMHHGAAGVLSSCQIACDTAHRIFKKMKER